MAEIAPYIKIVCEGKKTEPNYFNGWLRDSGYKAANPAFKAKDNSPRGVVKRAKEEYKLARRLRIPTEKIFIWAVFDRDAHQGIPEAIDEAINSGIHVAFSNVCFEYWILLHYERTQRAFANCAEIISYIRNTHDADYDKPDDHFTRLKHRIAAAMENGRWLTETHWEYDDRPIWDKNPYSDVYTLLEQIKDVIRNGNK